jgi:hypothetical protein
METSGLTKKSRVILEAIADGHTYEQILASFPAWTYHDISQAAAEALDAASAESPGKSHNERMEEIHKAHPRAYEKWSDCEDDRLRQLFLSQTPVKQIALTLQRQPSAIRSRLTKLNLLGPGLQTTLGEGSSAMRASGVTDRGVLLQEADGD